MTTGLPHLLHASWMALDGYTTLSQFREEQPCPQVTLSSGQAHMLPHALLWHRGSRARRDQVSYALCRPIKPQDKSMTDCCTSSPQASHWPQTTLVSKSFTSLFFSICIFFTWALSINLPSWVGPGLHKGETGTSYSSFGQSQDTRVASFCTPSALEGQC